MSSDAIRLPLRLSYAGASTIEDANGTIIVECRDHGIAVALVTIVREAWAAYDGNGNISTLSDAIYDLVNTRLINA